MTRHDGEISNVRDNAAAWKPRDLRSEDDIRELAKSHGRVLMGDGCYSTVMLGWTEIQMLLDEIDRLRNVAITEREEQA